MRPRRAAAVQRLAAQVPKRRTMKPAVAQSLGADPETERREDEDGPEEDYLEKAAADELPDTGEQTAAGQAVGAEEREDAKDGAVPASSGGGSDEEDEAASNAPAADKATDETEEEEAPEEEQVPRAVRTVQQLLL